MHLCARYMRTSWNSLRLFPSATPGDSPAITALLLSCTFRKGWNKGRDHPDLWPKTTRMRAAPLSTDAAPSPDPLRNQALSRSLTVALQIDGVQIENAGRAVAVRGFAARAVAWRDKDPWKGGLNNCQLRLTSTCAALHCSQRPWASDRIAVRRR